MKMKILAVTSVVAVVLAASGVAMAAGGSPARTTAKACVASGGALKLTQGTKCPRGTSPFTVLAPGGPGTALGYAHILPGYKFDASRSYNVKASNVISHRTGFLCFKGLAFKVHNAAITPDYKGVLNGQLPDYSLMLPPVGSLCGTTSPQAEVFTGLVQPGVNTPGADLGFYIIFY
jgi:hypothetical protein